VRLPGNATTVPTEKVAGQLPSIQALAIQSQNKAKAAANQKRAARLTSRATANPNKKLHRRGGEGGINIAKASVSVGEEIAKLPNQVYDAIKRSV
jgi:hypothetical protein